VTIAPVALAAAAGAGAGVIHVLTGPDHLAALSPLALSRGRKAWRLGVRWGLGHSGGALVLAGIGLLLRERFDLRILSGWSERAVGVSLVGIGLWALRRAWKSSLHVHPHTHDGVLHVHVHAHAPGQGHDPKTAAGSHAHEHTALGVGFLHGLSGGTHLWASLPALALPVPAAMGYLAGFAASSVVAMAGFAAALGTSVELFPAQARSAHRWVLGGAACAALVTGAVWLAGGAF
jgi:hypothetical protein